MCVCPVHLAVYTITYYTIHVSGHVFITVCVYLGYLFECIWSTFLQIQALAMWPMVSNSILCRRTDRRVAMHGASHCVSAPVWGPRGLVPSCRQLCSIPGSGQPHRHSFWDQCWHTCHFHMSLCVSLSVRPSVPQFDLSLIFCWWETGNKSAFFWLENQKFPPRCVCVLMCGSELGTRWGRGIERWSALMMLMCLLSHSWYEWFLCDWTASQTPGVLLSTFTLMHLSIYLPFQPEPIYVYLPALHSAFFWLGC